MGKVRTELDKLVKDAKDAWADHSISAEELKGLYGSVLSLAVSLRDEPDAEEDTAAALGKIYDEIIAPIDLKGVPEFIERWIDEGVKTAGRAAIHELFRQAKA